MKVLGIESSCDETAVAVVNEDGEVLSSIVWSQYDEHRSFGGVVPEIAARAHLEKIDLLIKDAMEQAKVSFDDLDGVAVAGGPGLIGGVIVGVMTAKAICWAHQIPFIAVNHLEGHALMARLTSDISYPYLLLLTSGGHCQILIVKGVGEYERLGSTKDDSAGECFDKVAKMIGVGYPGGPNVEKYALNGDEKRFKFPKPLYHQSGCDFSFSGLKTAVRFQLEKMDNLSETDKADLCASFQKTITDTLTDRLENGIKIFKEKYQGPLVVSGGVAANQYLRKSLEKLAGKYGMKFSAPPIHLCTDNGVMIAFAGMERLKSGKLSSLDFRPRPRWPLDEI